MHAELRLVACLPAQRQPWLDAFATAQLAALQEAAQAAGASDSSASVVAAPTASVRGRRQRTRLPAAPQALADDRQRLADPAQRGETDAGWVASPSARSRQCGRRAKTGLQAQVRCWLQLQALPAHLRQCLAV